MKTDSAAPTFGKPTTITDENVMNLMCWKENEAGKFLSSRQRPYNHLKLNRLMVSAGLHETKADFIRSSSRRSNLRLADTKKGAEADSTINNKRRPMGSDLPSATDPEYVYGRPIRSDVTIKGLLTHSYEVEYLAQKRNDEEKRSESARHVHSLRNSTRASSLVMEATISKLHKEPEKFGKLGQFAYVQSRTKQLWERPQSAPLTVTSNRGPHSIVSEQQKHITPHRERRKSTPSRSRDGDPLYEAMHQLTSRNHPSAADRRKEMAPTAGTTGCLHAEASSYHYDERVKDGLEHRHRDSDRRLHQHKHIHHSRWPNDQQ
mmetsp:Transcript_41870/g.67906  ORF Transcript_41870/g.67906 Transcript_41870/m.67906 type:complete len:319 (-) Transcript_41870:302-1258(-)